MLQEAATLLQQNLKSLRQRTGLNTCFLIPRVVTKLKDEGGK